MTTGTNKDNKTNVQNPLIDTSSVTVNAFNAIKNKEKADTNFILGQDDKTTWKSPNFKVKVKAWTQVDNKTHEYFSSLSIDVNVEDFMGTAELTCPYDSDLMAYWEPIRQTVVIYGANRGDYKILFIGRVRGVKQDGYEMVIEFQNYGWNFKQNVSQSYANDNVLNKDGYTIMRLMFEALKIDSWVISESAKQRLKQVGINTDGNLTSNGEEIKEMPDLLKRLQSSNPSKLVNKNTLNNKLREKYLHNIKNINYTLKYEKPTPVMKKIASQGNYTPGSNIYENAYGSASAGGAGGAGGVGGSGATGSSSCPSSPNSDVSGALDTVYSFNRSSTNDYSGARSTIINFASNNPDTYYSSVDGCLATMSKYTNRSDGRNAATDCMNAAREAANFARNRSNPINNAVQTATNWGRQLYNGVMNGLNNIGNTIHQVSTGIANGIGNFVNNGISTARNILGW